jgi:hypothetical protein
MVAYKDPVTGEFIAPPAGASLVPAPAAAVARASALPETASPGGGTMIALDGRFDNQLSVTLDDAGKLQGGCTQDSSP